MGLGCAGIGPARGGMVRIYYMGKAYEVPKGLTIMKALEYAGFRFIRGSGCRGGACGACGVIYRNPGEYRLRVGLACQTSVKDGMHLALLPYSPMVKPTYRIDELKPDLGSVLRYFPEIVRCVSCNACTKACPQDLEVMDAVQAIRQNDIAKAAELIFDCIACGLCSTRCPAEIRHPLVFQLVRRLYGRHLLPRARHLELRIEEISRGVWEAEFERLMEMPLDELKKIYAQRPLEG